MIKKNPIFTFYSSDITGLFLMNMSKYKHLENIKDKNCKEIYLFKEN